MSISLDLATGTAKERQGTCRMLGFKHLSVKKNYERAMEKARR
jgi:hypothetical protein